MRFLGKRLFMVMTLGTTIAAATTATAVASAVAIAVVTTTIAWFFFFSHKFNLLFIKTSLIFLY